MSSLTYHLIKEEIDDTIECLEFIQNPNDPYILASGGWDCVCRIWKISISEKQTPYMRIPEPKSEKVQEDPTHEVTQSSLFLSINYDDPILSLCWIKNSYQLLIGTIGGNMFHLDLLNQNKYKILALDTGIREIFHLLTPDFNLIITGNYNGIIALWNLEDLKAPLKQYNVNIGLYSMCFEFPLLSAGLSGGMALYFDMRKLKFNFFEPEIIFETSLLNLITSMTAMELGKGFVATSLESKVNVIFVDLDSPPKLEENSKKLDNKFKNDTFIFRCHRKNSNNSTNEESYLINKVRLNPIYGTLATCSSDGKFILWDFVSKSKIKDGELPKNIPLTAIAYSMDGNIFAFAGGNDWAEGQQNSIEFTKIAKIGLRFLSDVEKYKKVVERK